MYCTRAELTDHVLEEYLTAADNKKAETVATAISNIEAEMTEALNCGGYTITPDSIPATVKKVCAVIAAYNSVSAITSLIKTSANSENVWLPLQRKFERAEKTLDQIREGKVRLAAPEADSAQPNDTVVVVTPPSKFGDCWSKF